MKATCSWDRYLLSKSDSSDGPNLEVFTLGFSVVPSPRITSDVESLAKPTVPGSLGAIQTASLAATLSNPVDALQSGS